MLKALFAVIKQLAGLTTDTEDNKVSITKVESRLEIVTETQQRVVFDLERLKENEAHEREKLILKLEAILARSDRNLLTSGPTDHERIAVL